MCVKTGLAALTALAAAVLAGCTASYENRYMAMDVPAEKLRTVDTFDASAMSAPETPAAAAPAEPSAEALISTETALSLEQCRAAALENNLDLKVVLVDPTIAAETVNQAEAVFEPSLSSDLAYNVSDPALSAGGQSESLSNDLSLQFPLRTGGLLTVDAPVTRLEENPSGYTSNASVSLAQPLLRGAGVRTITYDIRIARYQSQVSQAQTKLEVMRVIAAVDRVYWRLYAARREVEVRRNEYDLAVAQLGRARRRVQAGAASEVEVIRAETGVAERVEAIITSGNTLRQRERDLKRSLNAPRLEMDSPAAIVPSTEPNPVHYRFDAARLVKAAAENRMEMLELELQIAQDASTIDLRRNQILPALALDYTYRVNGAGPAASDSFDLLQDRRFEDHSVGLSLELPLGNAAARSRLRQAIASRIQRLATRDQRRAQIQQEVLDAVDQLETSWQRVLANRQRTILAARNVDAETRQFELGLRTSTEVLDAQTRLADAQSAEISSLTDHQIAQVDLAFATGTLLGEARVKWAPAPVEGK
jgi:outer membrane protein TolC